MPKPSKAEWDEFVGHFNGLLGFGYLYCDGYLVQVQTIRVRNSVRFAVFVNGGLNPDWLNHADEGREQELCEEARRFFMHRKIGQRPKTIRRYEKLYGKRLAKSNGIYKKFIFPDPCWRSINSLVAHIKKHNDSIRIISYEEYRSMLKNIETEESK